MSIEFNGELRSKLLKAKSAEEVAELLKAAGQEASPEDAENIWQEIAHHNTDAELSVDELEAVSGGGYDRDWLEDGCAATVEPGSWCGSNDACYQWDVVYEHKPSKNTCPACGINLYVDHEEHTDEITTYYRCIRCGYVKVC